MMMATESNDNCYRQLLSEKLGKLFESKMLECEAKFQYDIGQLESMKYNFYDLCLTKLHDIKEVYSDTGIYQSEIPAEDLHLNPSYPAAINFNIINQVGTFSTTNIYGFDGVVNTIAQPNKALKLKNSVTINHDLSLNDCKTDEGYSNTTNLRNQNKKPSIITPKVISRSNIVDDKSYSSVNMGGIPDLKKANLKQVSLGNFKESTKLRKNVLVVEAKKEPDKVLIKSESSKKIRKIDYVASKVNASEVKRYLNLNKNQRQLNETKESIISECSMSESRNEMESQLSGRYSNFEINFNHEQATQFNEPKFHQAHKAKNSILSEDSLQAPLINFNDQQIQQSDNFTKNIQIVQRIHENSAKCEWRIDYKNSAYSNSLAILLSKELLCSGQRLKILSKYRSCNHSSLLNLTKIKLLAEYKDKLNELKINYFYYLNESKAELSSDFKISSTANQALMFIKEKSEIELIQTSTSLEITSSLINRFFSLFIILVFEFDPIKVVKIETTENKEYFLNMDYEFDATKEITILEFMGIEIFIDESVCTSNRENCLVNTVELFYMLQEKKYHFKSIRNFLQSYIPEVSKWKYDAIVSLKDSKEIDKVLNSSELIKCSKTVSFLSFAVKDIIKYMSATNSQKIPLYYLRDVTKQIATLESKIARLQEIII